MDLAHTSESSSDELYVSFEAWTRSRKIVSIGTNAGAEPLPFQGWHNFKEAFAPEVVARAVQQSKRPVSSCLDPFGGSGTTALASQFLGVEPTTIEVNPYLADLIEAKLGTYDPDDLTSDLGRIVRETSRHPGRIERFSHLPSTFIESNETPRWIFDRAVALRISAYLDAIDTLAQPHHRRLFRALLGGMLISISNVVVNGKGRRYRRGWEKRHVTQAAIDAAFQKKCVDAINEVHANYYRRCRDYTLMRGDCLSQLDQASPSDLAVFSPPYPNSFDYTDVYNVELWMLGYLGDSSSNQALRKSTLCSHVQIKREFKPAPQGSLRLSRALGKLRRERDVLWSRWIPEMVGHYFHDMRQVLAKLHDRLNAQGEVWAVVGDSRYAGIHIPVDKILADFAPQLGYEVVNVEPFRSMRASAQQGGQHQLNESLVVLRKTS